ncbi:MAG: hypothetical protein HOP27_03565 [Anaerolineales bacterium]|jgi:hypothetical protein|nr:hypothetical protein [Anaerolineales bacterium]
MENQIINKTKSNFGISLLTGCGTSLAAFVVLDVFFFILILLFVGNESGFAISLVLGFGISVILAFVALIVGGVVVFRAKQPRPLASGLLSAVGISILANIAIVGLGFLGQNLIQANTPDTNDMLNYFDILRGVALVIILVADVLAIVVGWLVYRRQRSKLTQ